MQRLQDLQADYRGILQKASRSALTVKLVDHLFTRPFISIPNVQDVLGVTYRSAANNVNRLVKEKILNPIPWGGRPKYYVAAKIYSVLYEDDIDEFTTAERDAF